LAAVTVSARRGLPQHRGQTPQPAKRNDRIATFQARFSVAPLCQERHDQTRQAIRESRSGYLPPIAGGPLLSGPADLFPRRRVMIACDVLRIGTVGLMAIPGMPFPALCALLFCTVPAGAPFSSARAALLPDVPGDIFVLGSAVGNISFQASQILGFVTGAAVVAVVDPYQTLGLDAVSFGISALIVAAGSRPRPLLVLRPADRKRGGPAAVVRPAAVEPGLGL
jgi:hypothetical protein